MEEGGGFNQLFGCILQGISGQECLPLGLLFERERLLKSGDLSGDGRAAIFKCQGDRFLQGRTLEGKAAGQYP